jgi:hypothetical protein
MVYFIEEAFKVYINNVLISLMNVLLCLLYALVGIFARPEAVAVFCKFKLE